MQTSRKFPKKLSVKLLIRTVFQILILSLGLAEKSDFQIFYSGKASTPKYILTQLNGLTSHRIISYKRFSPINLVLGGMEDPKCTVLLNH
jgi:hypothetical protein